MTLGSGHRRETLVSRRKFLAISGSVATGGVAGCVGSAQAQTDVSMGELNIDGDSATLNDVPSAITINVSGDFSVQSNQTPEQCQLTLQCHVGEDSLVDDIATDTHFGTKAGSYEISGDLLDHRDIIADDFAVAAGETITMPLLVRVILSVVSGGSIVSEEWVESKAPLSITAEGIVAQLSGSGSVSIVA